MTVKDTRSRMPVLCHVSVISPFFFFLLTWTMFFLSVNGQNLTAKSTTVDNGATSLPAQRSPSADLTARLSEGRIDEEADSTHLPFINSSRRPEVASCPEYCVCSGSEGLLTCNGEHIFPFPSNLADFHNLSRVSLENFKKSDLRAADLAGLMDLRELRLPRNGLVAIRNALFTPLRAMKRLDLSGNKLSLLANLTFIGLRSLLYLDLSSNRIAAIELGSFAYLPDLIQLDLHSNKLSNLPNDLFNGLSALQYLNLEVNQILDIQPRVMSHLPHLVHLNLAMNARLSSIAFAQVDFDDLLHLQYCDLSHCNFREVPRNLPEKIRDIRLTGNKLNVLTEKSLEKYSSLAVLVMDDCNITQVGLDVFRNLTNLERLWMNGNGLGRLPGRLPASLKGLYLDENKIQIVHRVDLSRLLDLQEIRLQRNQITTIESCAFCDAPQLTLLDLRANRLHTLNTALFPTVNSISRLDLSLNPLRLVGRDFVCHLSSLKQLEMSRVSTMAVDLPEGLFAFWPHLTTLDLSGSPALATQFLNQGSVHSNSSDYLRHLHSVSLRACQLSVLEENLRGLFSGISRIKMAQNELGCFAENRWLFGMMQREQKRFYKCQELKCATPKKLKDRKIVQLDLASLEEREKAPDFHPKRVESESQNEDFHKKEEELTSERQGKKFSSSPLDDPSSWMVTFVACLMTATVLTFLFLVLLGCCSLQKIRLKRISLSNKISRILRLAPHPFPPRIASNRTLYRSRDDSIFIIGTDSPYPAGLSPYEELDQKSLRNNLEGVYENDCLSTVSTIRSSIEIPV